MKRYVGLKFGKKGIVSQNMWVKSFDEPSIFLEKQIYNTEKFQFISDEDTNRTHCESFNNEVLMQKYSELYQSLSTIIGYILFYKGTTSTLVVFVIQKVLLSYP